MKLKNLLMSTILIFGVNSFIISYINENINLNNQKIINESKADDKISINLSNLFYGFVFHFNIDFPVNKISIFAIDATTDHSTNIIQAFFNSDQSNILSLNCDMNLIVGNIHDGSDVENWFDELNKDNPFSNLSFIGLPNFQSLESDINYKFDVLFYEKGGIGQVFSFKSNALDKLADSNFDNYERSDINQISYSYISDETSLYYGWFDSEIIIDKYYIDKINENSVKFYYMNEETEYDSSNFKLNFDSSNNSYKFLLKSYQPGTNYFWIDGEFKYNLGNGIVPNLKFHEKFIPENPEIYYEPTLGVSIQKLDKIDGLQNFRLIYSVTLNPKNINETIDNIYVADSSNPNIPFNGLDSSKFNLISGQGKVDFSIIANQSLQVFNNLELIVDTKYFSVNGTELSNQSISPIDSFSVDPLDDSISVKLSDHPIDQTKTSATYHYDINIHDNYKLTNAYLVPTENNPLYIGEYKLPEKIEFNFTDYIPLSGEFRVIDLPSSSQITTDPEFKIVLEYQTAFEHENKIWDNYIFKIERAQGYKLADLPEKTIKLVNVEHNKVKIGWKINENYLGDDKLESVILKDESNNLEYESKINYSSNNIYVFGEFNIDELEYNTNYTYTLTYNIHTWIDESIDGYIYSLDNETVSFISGNKDYTNQLLTWIGVDALVLLLTLIPTILTIMETFKTKYNIVGYKDLKKDLKKDEKLKNKKPKSKRKKINDSYFF